MSRLHHENYGIMYSGKVAEKLLRIKEIPETFQPGEGEILLYML